MDAEKLLREAMLKSDVSALEDLLADELSFISASGERLTKSQDLESHRNGKLKFKEISTCYQFVKKIQNIAIIQAKVTMRFTFEEIEHSGRYLFTRVWHRSEKGGWQVVAAQSTAIPS